METSIFYTSAILVIQILTAVAIPWGMKAISDFFSFPKLSTKSNALLIFTAVGILLLSHILNAELASHIEQSLFTQTAPQIGKQILLISLIYSLFTFLLRLCKSELLIKHPITKHYQCLLISFITAAIMGAVWWVYGTKASFDFSVRQVEQIKTGIYEKAHPVIHTLFCEFLLQIHESWNTIVAVQIIIFTMSVYAICWWCKRAGLSIYYAILAIMSIIVCTFPYIHFIIKDSLMLSFFIIALVGLMAWIQKADRWSMLVSTVGLIGVGLFRYDGQAIVIIVSIFLSLLAVISKRHVRHILIMCAFPIAAIFSAHYVLPKLVNAKSEMVGTKLAMPAEIICEIVVKNGNVTNDEKSKVLNLIMPIDMIQKHHTMGKSFEGQKYIWSSYFENEQQFRNYSFAFNLSGKEQQIIPLFLNLAVKNLGITTSHLIQQSRIISDVRSSLRYPCSLFFFISVFMFIIFLKRKEELKKYIPFLPIFSVSTVCMFVATTFEIRYGLPIIVGTILLIGYINTQKNLAHYTYRLTRKTAVRNRIT